MEFAKINAGAVAGPAAPLVTDQNTDVGSSAKIAGDTISKLGMQLQEAQKRTNDRNDTIHRSRAFDEFQNLIFEEEQRLATEGDIANPETSQTHGAFLKEKFNTLMAAHQGVASGEGSIVRLGARLATLQAESARRVSASVTTAARKQLRGRLSHRISGIAVEAGQTGDIAAAHARIKDEIDEAAASLSPAEEETSYDTGMAQALNEIFHTHMSNNNFDDAEKVLQFPDAAGILGVEGHRKIVNAITVGRHNVDIGRKKGIEKRAEAAATLGMTSEEFDAKWEKNKNDPDMRQLLGLDRDDDDPRPPPAITNMESAVALFKKINDGRDPNPEETTNIRLQVMSNAGLDIGGGGDNKPFGDSLRGNAKANILRLSQNFAAGKINKGDPDHELYESSVLEIQRPFQIGVDPQTQRPIFSAGTLPPSVIDAYKRRGEAPPRPNLTGVGQSGAPAGAPGATPSATGAPPTELGEKTLAGQEVEAFDGTSLKLDQPVRPEQTLYGRIGSLTGFQAGVSGVVAENPLGSAMGFTAPEITAARTALLLFGEKLANALTTDTNVRANEARKALMDKMGMEPTLAGDSALRPKMFAVADLIISTMKQDVVTLQNIADPKAQQAALAEMRKLNQLLRELGVPVLANSLPELEAMELPDGTEFRKPNGETGTWSRADAK